MLYRAHTSTKVQQSLFRLSSHGFFYGFCWTFESLVGLVIYLSFCLILSHFIMVSSLWVFSFSLKFISLVPHPPLNFPSCIYPDVFHLCLIVCPGFINLIISTSHMYLPLCSLCHLSDRPAFLALVPFRFKCALGFLMFPCVMGFLISGLWIVFWILDYCLCLCWILWAGWTDFTVLTSAFHSTVSFAIPLIKEVNWYPTCLCSAFGP